MEFNEYQKKQNQRKLYPEINPPWIYAALGLSGETGEVLEKLKKVFRDEKDFKITPDKLEDLKKELGDVLWYLSALANDLNLSLDDIAETNLKKIEERIKNGTLRGSGDRR